MAETVRQRLLEYAAQQIGRAEVAKRLKVPEEKLAGWMADGGDAMPDSKLGALADLIDSIGKARDT